MILQPQHSHQQPPNKITESLPTKTTNNNSAQLGSQVFPPQKTNKIQPPAILQNLFRNSIQLISQKGTKQIKEKIQFIQQKVHLSFSTAPNQYLDHLKPDIQRENHQAIAEIIDIQNWLAVNKILSGKTVLKGKSDIKDIGSNIKEKIADMKRSIMSLSSIEKRANAQFENLLEFKKKNYWAHQTQKGKKIKSFVSKMKRIHSQQKKRQEKQLIQREQKVKSELQKQKKLTEQARKDMYMKELEKQALWRKQRSKYTEQQKKKKQKIEELLQKFNADKPFYMRKQEQFVKNVLEPQQEERIKKLQEIRAQHQPLQQQEIEQHFQKYQEYKESLMQEKKRKHEEQQQMNNKLQQQLKELYHCKFHKEIQPRFYNFEKESAEQKLKKVKNYEKTVLQNHRPSIDLLKRSKLQEQILDLQLREDKKKRKVVQQDGSVVIEEKPEFNARRIGVQYLQQMKEQNQGKPRKKQDRSASMMEISQGSKLKRIDYLRENRPNLKYKKTLGEWKKVMADGSYSPRQKFQSIMQQAMVLQQKAHQKEQMMNCYKKGEKAIELKQQMDKLYLQSVAAKLVVLKDVILKQ